MILLWFGDYGSKFMINVFVGYDERESAVFHAFNQSVLDHTKVPVSIIPVHGPMLEDFDGQQDGTNRFIYSRYLVPNIMDYQGWAIFADGDMIVLGDLQELWALRDPTKAVQVVKHSYRTSSRRKYIGTPIENDNIDYPRKNWSSIVLWNCSHLSNRCLTRDYVATAGAEVLHRFKWLRDSEIGALPLEWNMLVNEVHCENPKLIHYTLGCPGIEGYKDCPHADVWHEKILRVNQLTGQRQSEMLERAYGNRRSADGGGKSQVITS